MSRRAYPHNPGVPVQGSGGLAQPYPGQPGQAWSGQPSYDAAASSQHLPPGGQMMPPPPGGQMRPLPPGGQMMPLPSGGQMRPLPPGGQMMPPPSGGQMRPPPPGGQVMPPPPGGQMRPPPPGGQMMPGGPTRPLPPTSGYQDYSAINSLSSGMQRMHIGHGPGSQPPPPSGPPSETLHSSMYGHAGHGSGQGSGHGSGQGAGHQLPPPPKAGQQYVPPGHTLPPPPVSGQPGSLSGQGMLTTPSGQGLGQKSSLPPPPKSGGPGSGQGLPPPSSGQGLLPSPPVEQGLLPPPTSGQGLPPRPNPGQGQGLLPPPTSGQGLLPSPALGQGLPPHAMGPGLLPPPTSGQGLLPPPPSGQGLLPAPSSGYTVSSRYPAPPTTAPPTTAPPRPTGQGFPLPPTSGQGLPPPPTSGQVYVAPSVAPPPAGQPPPSGQAGHHMYGPPRPMPGQGSQPPPSSSSSTAAPPTHPGMAPAPHQPPQGPATQTAMSDPQLQPVNLLESRNILPPAPITPPKIVLPGGLGAFNPNPDVMCSTINAIPATGSLLGKLKLPLAIHIHPYRDLNTHECPVIHPSVIVRCRVCRTYINPFVVFIDSRHWRCNLCFRPNALPEDFDYNPQTGKHGDRSHRMEIRRSSVEYIAPSEYMLRPPQPSVYYFLIDVSYNAISSGVVGVACRCLLDCLDRLPGDARTMIGFLTYDSSLHFYNLNAGSSQPQMLVVSDVDDAFLPSPDFLLVNLKESKDMVRTLLEDLPAMFADASSTQSALGAALQTAEKLLHSIGGRVTVLQSSMPNLGPGALKYRDIKPSATKMDALNMAAGSDFYKKAALECSSQQIAVDLFTFSSQFIDLSTMSCVSKFSAGQVFHYSDFHHTKEAPRQRFEKDFSRYLTRKIGFEAVMRIRCTEGLSLHTFHGNFFVRSTDLLSLPNTNPDHGYTMNISIDESLKDMSAVCFQAALLYTSHRGERRIRVHTLCLPVTTQPSVLYSKLNIQAIIGVLANMAVDRATSSTLGDARDALMNTVVDSTKMYRSHFASSLHSSQFCLPSSLSLLPLFILSLLKNPAFTLSTRVSHDVRTQAMNLIKSHPLSYLMLTIYPRLYALHALTEKDVVEKDNGQQVMAPPILQLSAEKMTRYGIYLMDCGLSMYIWVCKDAPPQLIEKMFGVSTFELIPEGMTSLPRQDNEISGLVNRLIKQIRSSRQHFVSLLVIREGGPHRLLFIDRLMEDRTEDGTSYYEFLSHVSRQIGK